MITRMDSIIDAGSTSDTGDSSQHASRHSIGTYPPVSASAGAGGRVDAAGDRDRRFHVKRRDPGSPIGSLPVPGLRGILRRDVAADSVEIEKPGRRARDLSADSPRKRPVR
jgi:hypothetical protein